MKWETDDDDPNADEGGVPELVCAWVRKEILGVRERHTVPMSNPMPRISYKMVSRRPSIARSGHT